MNKSDLKLHFKWHGIKRIPAEDGFRTIPKADLYIDCRAIAEAGVPGWSGRADAACRGRPRSAHGKPLAPDVNEPEYLGRTIAAMQLKYVVITSVDRDDLKDMGSIIWAETIKAIRRMNPETTLETLIPDFKGVKKNMERVFAERVF